MGSSAAAGIGDGAVGGLEEWSFESDGGWWVIYSSADPPRAERIEVRGSRLDTETWLAHRGFKGIQNGVGGYNRGFRRRHNLISDLGKKGTAVFLHEETKYLLHRVLLLLMAGWPMQRV